MESIILIIHSENDFANGFCLYDSLNKFFNIIFIFTNENVSIQTFKICFKDINLINYFCLPLLKGEDLEKIKMHDLFKNFNPKFVCVFDGPSSLICAKEAKKLNIDVCYVKIMQEVMKYVIFLNTFLLQKHNI